ncbi:MAG: NADH-quinone oxidoreductase subunit J [Bacteroidetes bacterium]|nr:NADH-quinone oxidoreductase subunit J [Bacteroidota bacterium]
MIFLFYLLSGVALLSALMVVFSRSPINSVIHLIICFLAIAGHYILLNAQFLAVVHIIVYTGAIMVLFLFVIMLLNLNKENEPHKKLYTKLAAIISGGMLLLVLTGAVKSVALIPFNEKFDSQIGLVGNFGKILFNEFMLPFEASSVLFLSAIIGAMILGKKEKITNNE